MDISANKLMLYQLNSYINWTSKLQSKLSPANLPVQKLSAKAAK